MEINLGSGKIKVTLGDKSFEIRDPNFEDIESIQKDEDQQKAVYNFLVRLGAEKEVVDTIGIITLKRFVGELMAPFQEKK